MQIGQKLKDLRVLKGLTQEELANRAELSKSFISQVERDLTSPSIATLVDLSLIHIFNTSSTPGRINRNSLILFHFFLSAALIATAVVFAFFTSFTSLYSLFVYVSIIILKF